MHIDKQARNFIVSGLVIVSVFALWLSFAKLPDTIKSFGKKQAVINGNVQKQIPPAPPIVPQKPLLYKIRIGTVDIPVEVAETQKEKEQGLSMRESLPQDQGLLFLFDVPARYQFWMKDMKFSIDIIWIDSGQKVVDITENADPASYPQTFSPQLPAQYILETNAFFAKTRSIHIGDSVDFSKILR